MAPINTRHYLAAGSLFSVEAYSTVGVDVELKARVCGSEAEGLGRDRYSCYRV